MSLIHQKIEEYLVQLHKHTDPILMEMEKLAEETNFPIIGHQEGAFLKQLVELSQSKHIFEFGSGFGYSAYWMSQGIAKNGKIICTEMNKSHIQQAHYFLKKANLENKIDFRHGNALEVFHDEPGPFDLIFCDFAKTLYLEALLLSIPKLKKGGLFIADNVLWSGWVAYPLDKAPETVAIREFNQMIFNHPDLQSTLIPLRDGVSVSIKK